MLGKHSMTSLNVEIVSPQKTVKTRILSELNVSQVNSRNSRLEASNFAATKSTLKFHSTENSRKNSLQPSSNATANDTNCRGNAEGTDGTRKESKLPETLRKISDARESHCKRSPKLSKTLANAGKNESNSSFSVREKVLGSVRNKDASKIHSSKESSPVMTEKNIHPERGSFLRISSAKRIPRNLGSSVPVSPSSTPAPETVTKPFERGRRQRATPDNVSGEPDVVVEPGFVSDRFEVGGVLGEGNFAVVKRCRARSTDRDYAMKIIAKKTLKRKEKMVDNELKILKQCRHLNIVRLFDVYETQSDVYLIMELVDVR